MELPSSTSDFNKISVEKLKIQIIGTHEKLVSTGSTHDAPTDLYLKNMDIKGIGDYKDNQELTNSEKSLSNYIVRILENEKMTIGTSESHTDSMVNYILKKLGLDEYPFVLSLQPVYKFIVGNKTITSIPEFGIEKNGLVVFIDEDKHISNIGQSKAWGEYQIAGEMLAVASTNYNRIFIDRKRVRKDSQPVYSMRVIGTRFTFYKADVTHSYLDSLGNGLPDTEMTIYRYPNNNDSFSHYNYTDPEERKLILDMLYSLRNQFN